MANCTYACPVDLPAFQSHSSCSERWLLLTSLPVLCLWTSSISWTQEGFLYGRERHPPWKLTQITTPSVPISSPLKKSAISDSEALKGSPRSRTTLLLFLKSPTHQVDNQPTGASQWEQATKNVWPRWLGPAFSHPQNQMKPWKMTRQCCASLAMYLFCSVLFCLSSTAFKFYTPREAGRKKERKKER